MKVDIAGLKIDATTKIDLLDAVLARIKNNQKTFVTTPYSEFLYRAFLDPKLLETFNRADFAVADGIGIFWAKRYLEIPLSAKSFWGKILQAFWQIIYSLAAIILYSRFIYDSVPIHGRLESPINRHTTQPDIPEKIVGADLIWDLAKLAANNNLSIYLLGGFGNTPELAAEKLTTCYIHSHKRSKSLKIAGWSNKNPNDSSVIADVNSSVADILLVAYGPVNQEKWIVDNLPKLNIKLAIGVGGSLDYLAGIKSAPPKFIRYGGLEWLWRLITQPYRLKRIWQATFGLISKTLLHKIYQIMPLRKNAVCVILNKNKSILVCKRNPKPQETDAVGEPAAKFLNYWQLPQGGVGEDLDIISGARREALEEVSLNDLDLLYVSQKHYDYQFPLSWQRIFKKNYRYRGQSQNIIYFKFSGKDEEVTVDRKEFVDYRWVEANQLFKIIHPEKLNLTKIVVDDLKQLV